MSVCMVELRYRGVNCQRVIVCVLSDFDPSSVMALAGDAVCVVVVLERMALFPREHKWALAALVPRMVRGDRRVCYNSVRLFICLGGIEARERACV